VESLRVHMRYNQKHILSLGRSCLAWTRNLLHVYPGPARETWQHCGVHGKLKFRAPLNRHSLNIFGQGQGWPTLVGTRTETAGNFGRNFVACGNLNLPATYFRLFKWRLSAPYSLAPRATALLAAPYTGTTHIRSHNNFRFRKTKKFH